MTFLIPGLRALSEVLTAAVAMTAFSVMLFNLQFVRRKQKLSFALIPLLLVITVIYSADALETMAVGDESRMLWQQIHWTGFVILPAVCLSFALVLLELTGKEIGRGRLGIAILNLLVTCFFLVMLWTGRLFSGIHVIGGIGTSMVPTDLTALFWVFFAVNILGTFWILGISLSRTRTQTSRRRMIYLIVGLLGIAIGSFPLLLFGSGAQISHYPLLFWSLSVLGNATVTVMVLLLGYSTATFSVSWSDRLTRLRMIEWILRGPVTASLTLWVVTMINRSGDVLGLNIAGLNTLATVVSIILLEYLITVIIPRIEQGSLIGLGPEDYQIYNEFKGMMVFTPEMITYLEALTAALCDRFQARDGFFAVWNESGTFDPVIFTGESSWKNIPDLLQTLPSYFSENGDRLFFDETGVLVPVFNHDGELDTFLGVIGLADIPRKINGEGDQQVLEDAIEKARTVLWQRRYLTSAYQVLRSRTDTSGGDSFRSGIILDRGMLLEDSETAELDQVSVWVKDALTHYWGGPRLMDSPLLKWNVVQQYAAENHDNEVNSLRTVLKNSLEELRPEGERSMNGEWTLYNLIDMRFFEKMKVKEAAQRLSMSEADFYRKQKVAVEALAKVIIRKEHPDHE